MRYATFIYLLKMPLIYIGLGNTSQQNRCFYLIKLLGMILVSNLFLRLYFILEFAELDAMIDSKILKCFSTNSYQCGDCLKVFHQRVNARTHVEAKHIINPNGIRCDICQTTCSTRQGLRKHKSRYH